MLQGDPKKFREYLSKFIKFPWPGKKQKQWIKLIYGCKSTNMKDNAPNLK